MVNAILLAGTHADKSKLFYGKNKAFIEINGKPVILNVLNALQNAKHINKVAVVGPRIDLEKVINSEVDIIDESLAPKESRRFIENVMVPYNFLSNKYGQGPTFITACELPVFSPDTVDSFIENCDELDFQWGLINTKYLPPEIERLKKSAPLDLKERGYFRTANMALCDWSNISDKKREFIEHLVGKAFPIRRTASKWAKRRLKLFILGHYPKLTKKYYTERTLTENDIKSALKKKPGISFGIVETNDWRAAADIDDKDELALYNNKKTYDKLMNNFTPYQDNQHQSQ
jgi:GTP:adenosylcobinamide-phosphate guanylyltransferase